MSNAIFPTLPGLGWPVNKKPYFSTIVAPMAGGQEVRIPNYPFPLEQFDLPINHLHGDATVAPGLADFQQLWSFYVARLGPFDSFLYFDPTDNYTVQNASWEGLTPATGRNVIGAGDGNTKDFQLYRSKGGVLQPVYAVNGITASLIPPIPTPFVNVLVNGAPVAPSGSWTVSAAGMLSFTTAPSNGASIAADFSYLKRCVFAEDHLEFSNFMQNLFKVGKITLRQVYA